MAKEVNVSEKKNVEKEFLAPDGGWGWMVVLGTSLSNIVVIPIMQSFGLIFIDRFYDLNFTSTDVTSLISINSSFGMILGIFNAPLLKKYGYRKMAFFGITLFTTGVFFTGLANNYVQFLIAYGMVASLGMMCTMGSFSLAMNTYFKNKKKRSKASGFTMTLTGIGPIVMPLLISFLLSTYGVKWTVFILCAINLHSYVGACLLQPIKWHVRKPKDEEAKMEPDNGADESEEKPIEFPDTNSLFGGDSSISGSKMSLYRRYGRSQSAVSATSTGKLWRSVDSIPKIKTVSQELYRSDWKEKNGFDAKRQRSVTCLDNDDYGDMMKSMLSILETPTKIVKLKRLASIETLGVQKEEDQISGSDKPLLSICSSEEKNLQKNGQIYKNTTEEIPKEEKQTGCCFRIGETIKDMYDLDLLVDPIFLNLMIGMSIAIIGELIFSLLTPFILEELGLDLDQKAKFMSVTAITDLVFRFIAPFVGGWLGLGSRRMYLCALFLLLITRATMFLTNSFEGLLAVAAGLGLGKGFRTVYWGLVIPDYVPLRKYPSAAAFQSLANGLLLLLSGPLIGFVVAINNRYTNVIIVSNVLTLITIVMWCLEFSIVRCRKKGDEVDKLEK